MPIFVYKAVKGKRRVKGDLDAANLEMAEAALRRRGMSQIRVKPKPKDLLEGTFLEGRVKDRDMVIFSRQFATMIDSGVPILQALQVMCEQTENPKLRRKLYEVRNDIEGGSSLYEAL
ncbi:MAG: type II secretion system F family protein, partial [Thermodesulfobacteriota bacterium]